MPTPLTDADKVLRNDTGKDIVTQLTAIKTAIENGGGGGGGASTVSQLTDVLLSANIPDGDVLVRDNNLTGGKLWKNVTITVELTQAEYDQLVADDEVLPDVNYYITDAPSMQGTSADLSYDGTTTSTYAKIEVLDSTKADKTEIPTLLTNSGYNIASIKLYPATSLTGNLNTLLTDGIYQVGNITVQTNAPTDVGYSGCIKVLHITSSYVLQEAICDSGRKTRLSFDGGTTWGAWY